MSVLKVYLRLEPSSVLVHAVHAQLGVRYIFGSDGSVYRAGMGTQAL